MSTVYGPVPSWRFGRSLGIDAITPPKKCTFNCVYCQLGKTRVHIPKPEMLGGPPVDAERVLKDLKGVLKRLDLKTIDIVTFSGTGEPTLNLKLEDIAKKVKASIDDTPMAILTNSSLFYRDDIRKNLVQFDVIVAKLDIGDDETLRLINRPADEGLDTETIIDSIKRLKTEVRGTVALEVMLLRSEDGKITNVEGKHLRNLLDAILDVKPDLVQLEVPYRPPSESFVKSPSQEKVRLIVKELSEALGENRLWAYGLHDRRGKPVTWLTHVSLERETLNLLERRPCRVVDVSASLGIESSTAWDLLRRLEEKGLVVAEISKGERYYSHRLPK